jgi:hypothetical protein
MSLTAVFLRMIAVPLRDAVLGLTDKQSVTGKKVRPLGAVFEACTERFTGLSHLLNDANFPSLCASAARATKI